MKGLGVVTKAGETTLVPLVAVSTGGRYGMPGFSPVVPGRKTSEFSLPAEKESVSTKFD